MSIEFGIWIFRIFQFFASSGLIMGLSRSRVMTDESTGQNDSASARFALPEYPAIWSAKRDKLRAGHELAVAWLRMRVRSSISTQGITFDI